MRVNKKELKIDLAKAITKWNIPPSSFLVIEGGDSHAIFKKMITKFGLHSNPEIWAFSPDDTFKAIPFDDEFEVSTMISYFRNKEIIYWIPETQKMDYPIIIATSIDIIEKLETDLNYFSFYILSLDFTKILLFNDDHDIIYYKNIA